MTQFTCEFDMPPMGYSISSALPHQEVQVQTGGLLTTDDGELLYKYLEGFTDEKSISEGLFKAGVPASSIRVIVNVFRTSTQSTCHVNFDTVGSILFKGDKEVAQGDFVYLDDIADIRSLALPLPESERYFGFAFAIRSNWRVAFCFNYSNMLDTEPVYGKDDLCSMAGQVLNRLTFHHIFGADPVVMESMNGDGWFPYIRLPNREAIALQCAYREKLPIEDILLRLESHFDHDRMKRIVASWRRSKGLKPHMEFLERGVQKYLECDAISCISILTPKIEGIYRTSSTRSSGGIRQAVKEIHGAFRDRVPGITALLPDEFSRFLRSFLDKKLVDEQEKLEFGRHAIAHGVLPHAQFTQMRSLQLILIIDQISWYLS